MNPADFASRFSFFSLKEGRGVKAGFFILSKPPAKICAGRNAGINLEVGSCYFQSGI